MQPLRRNDRSSEIPNESGTADGGDNTYLVAPATDEESPSLWRKSIIFILLSVSLERLAFYSFRTSLSYYLTKEPLCWTAANASDAAYVLNALAHFLSFPSGVIPDLVSSRVAVYLGYAFYVLGYTLATVLGLSTDGVNVTSKHEGSDCSQGNHSQAGLCSDAGLGSPCKIWVYTICVMFGIATALFRATMPSFGADQVRSQGLEVTRSFLAWYYWAVNVGSLLSYSAVTYLQHKVGFGAGFMTPYLMVVISCLLFASGSHVYRWRSPNRIAILNFFGIIKVAILQCLARVKRKHSHSTAIGCFESAEVIHGGIYSSVAVEKVKAAGRIFAALFLMLPFWLIYSRVLDAFAQEGLHMSQANINGELQIASLFNNIGLCVAMPLCNLVIYPLVGRCGYRMTMHKRLLVGMATCIVCLVTAGAVELKRVDGLATGRQEQIGGISYNVSSVSILWEIPQNFLLGATEMFTIVTAMELTYIAAPRSMQSIMMGLFHMFFGIGDLLNLAIRNVPYLLPVAVQRSFHLEYYYFMVAALLVSAVVVVWFIGRVFNLGLDAITVPTSRPVPQRALLGAASVAIGRHRSRFRYMAGSSTDTV